MNQEKHPNHEKSDHSDSIQSNSNSREISSQYCPYADRREPTNVLAESHRFTEESSTNILCLNNFWRYNGYFELRRSSTISYEVNFPTRKFNLNSKFVLDSRTNCSKTAGTSGIQASGLFHSTRNGAKVCAEVFCLDMCVIQAKYVVNGANVGSVLSCWTPVDSVCLIWPVSSCVPFAVRHGKYNYCYPSMVCSLHNVYMHRSHCMGGSAFGCYLIYYPVKSSEPRGLRLGMKCIHKNVGDTALISQKCINGLQVPIKH